MTELVWGANGVDGRPSRARKIPRSLSYTGYVCYHWGSRTCRTDIGSCWTCRERRVKCDERPGSCAVCAGAKLSCAGYDVRLIWKAGQATRLRHTPRTSRRQIKLDQHSCHLMTEHEVMRTITKIDRAANKPATTTLGPFSVFSVQAPGHSDSPISCIEGGNVDEAPVDEAPDDEVQHGDDKSDSQHQLNELDYNFWNEPILTDNTFECLDSLGTNMAALSDATDARAHQRDKRPNSLDGGQMGLSSQTQSPESLDEIIPYSTSADVTGMELGPSGLVSSPSRDIALLLEEDNTTTHPLDLLNDPRTWQDRLLTDTESFPRRNELSSFSLGPFVSLSGNAATDMLIHHYAKHMVHLMQPVAHQSNPFQTIYLPLAIEGSPNMDIVCQSDGTYSASVTVFHSLMAMAAIHLQSLQSRGESLQRLACHHKQRALVALRSALATQSSNYKDLMTAILSLVSADIIDGGTSDHWIHLEAAVQLQASRHYAPIVSRETRQLNSICRMLHLFAQTAQPQPEPQPWPRVKHFSSDAHPDFLEPSIEFIYGITTSVAWAILRIYQLVPYVAYYKDQGYPESLMRECEALGDTLCSWSIHSEPFSAIDPQQENMLKVAQAQAKAFYYAALIYYYRSIQGCSRESLHGEQQAAIAAMNEAEDLKVSSGEDSSLPAPITWPAFVASCDAVGEDRQEWEKWWCRVQKYRMGNYSKQQAIIRRVWDECDSNETLTDWRDALAAMNLRIIPV